jgi:ribosome biogenesis GTPase A
MPDLNPSNLLIADSELLEKKRRLGKVIQQLTLLSTETGASPHLETLQWLQNQTETPFSFVVVGEVKAGKSSFINALLDSGEEICKTGVAPTTDVIQIISYGAQRSEEILDKDIKKISLPIEILHDISIVDTPGTNTVIEDHQKITEGFVPYADLIVFVFEAKNPYRQSSWDFLSFLKEEWHRKIIFVLQQKDLIPEDDLKINMVGVKEMAAKKGVAQAVVFSVSAKEEQEGNKTTSGYVPVRSYISENFTGGLAAEKKFQSNLNSALTLAKKVLEDLNKRKNVLDEDKAFRSEISGLLDMQTERTRKQIQFLSEKLIESYEQIIALKYHDLRDGLSFTAVLKRSFNSIFGNEKNIKEWLDGQSTDLELKLNKSLKERLDYGILDVAETLQSMCKEIDSKVVSSTGKLQNRANIASDIAEKRASVLKELQENFRDFLKDKENFYDETIIDQSTKMAPNLAKGSGIALVGVMLTAIANGAVFDITGGVLTALGVGFAGVTLGLNRSKILNHFQNETAKGTEKMKYDLEHKLQHYAERIRFKIEQNFNDFDDFLLEQENKLTHLYDMYEHIEQELTMLSK